MDGCRSRPRTATLDLITSGGAAHIIRETIKTYFEDLDLGSCLSFADEQPLRLIELVSSLPETSTGPALALRMADCYGLFQGLLGKLNPATV